MRRRRIKQILTFADRLKQHAEQFRREAETKQPGPERDALMKKVCQAETALRINEWLSSPGSSLQHSPFEPDPRERTMR